MTPNGERGTVTSGRNALVRYDELKRDDPHTLLLFRFGAVYKLYHLDAMQAARLLGPSLVTTRDGPHIVNCVVIPEHHLDGYLAILLGAGERCAIIEDRPMYECVENGAEVIMRRTDGGT